MKFKHEMGSSRSCSSTSSSSSGATNNHTSGNSDLYSTTTTIAHNSTAAANGRVPRRIMCRCCLSEQQLEQSQSESQLATALHDDGMEEESDTFHESSTLTGYVSLDTLAMVDLRTDQDSFGNDSAPLSAMTLLDCLNACAGIGASVADVLLPQHICLDCCHTLETCCEFIRCVRNADTILRRRCMAPRKRRWTNGGGVELERQSTEAARRRRGQQSASEEKLQVGKKINGHVGGQLCQRKTRRASVEDEAVDSPTLDSRTVLSKRPTITNGSIAANELCHDLVAKCQNASLNKLISKSCDKACSASLPQVDETLGAIALHAERSSLRSLDSGIEIDDDPSASKPKDNNNSADVSIQCHYEEYEGHTYVVSAALSQDLQRFHRNTRKTTGQTYKCGFCIFECIAQSDLHKHNQIHLGPPQYSCHICQFACHFRHLLVQHMSAAHCDVCDIVDEADHNNDELSAQVIAINGYAHTPTKYHCHLCARYLISSDALQQHLESHKVYCQCTVCAFKSSTRENVLEHMAKEHKMLVDRRLAVKYVPLRRRTSEQLTKPAPSPTPAVSVPAALPNPAPKPTTNYNKHRKHLCQFCGKCFERRFHLLKHEYKVHRLDIDAMDTLKHKMFKSNSAKHAQLKYLRQRKAAQIEHGASKFQCDICAADFRFNFELKYHMRTHKATTASCNSDQLVTSSTECAAAWSDSGQQQQQQARGAKALSCLNYAQAVREATECGSSDRQLSSDQFNLLELVTQPPPMHSLDASPSSSNHSGDINYDDQLYVNEFDLGLLDCSVGLVGF